MKQLFTIILFVLFFLVSFAQQDAQFSHNMFNQMSVNPGYAGSSGDIRAFAISRQQWMGIPGNPTSNTFTLDASLTLFGKDHGLALSIIDDRLGVEQNFNARLAYAFRKQISIGELGLGIDFGIFNKQMNRSELTSADDEVFGDEQGKMVLDLSIGAFYHTDELYIGVSASHLNGPEVKYEGEGMNPYLKRHFFFGAGYNLQLPFPLFEVQPSIFCKSDGASVQVDVNTTVLYNKKIWGGVSYRVGDAFVPIFGIELQNGIKIGMAYDITTSKLRKESNGTFEFMLSYRFDLSIIREPERYRSVRFL
jgi:type IX secretion system PorP/SprF family membrane protein